MTVEEIANCLGVPTLEAVQEARRAAGRAPVRPATLERPCLVLDFTAEAGARSWARVAKGEIATKVRDLGLDPRTGLHWDGKGGRKGKRR